MNEELKRIFGTYIEVGDTSDTKQIPTAHIRYFGSEKTYVVWSLIGERPGMSADDDCIYSVAMVDVDVYSDGNYIEIVSKIKKLMLDNDWIWIEDSPEMYEEDTNLYHITCTFEKERSL